MKRISAPVKLAICGAAMTVVSAVAGSSASGQTTSTSTSTSPTSSAAKKPPTSATADMVNEAIQRSQARAAKAQQSGVPEQWGSEEPFTYDPNKKNFTASQQ